MARTVKALGSGGQRRAERERGWSRVPLRKGPHALESGFTGLDAFSARGRQRAENLLPALLPAIKAIVDSQRQTDPPFRTTRVYTRLRAAAVRTLGGTLRVSFIDGFRPMEGDSFQFLDFLRGHQGMFGAVLSNLPGIQLHIDPDTGTTLVVDKLTPTDVPEPATVLLMASGLLGLLLRRRFTSRRQRMMKE